MKASSLLKLAKLKPGRGWPRADQPVRLIRFDRRSRAGEPADADGSAADGMLDRGFI